MRVARKPTAGCSKAVGGLFYQAELKRDPKPVVIPEEKARAVKRVVPDSVPEWVRIEQVKGQKTKIGTKEYRQALDAYMEAGGNCEHASRILKSRKVNLSAISISTMRDKHKWAGRLKKAVEVAEVLSTADAAKSQAKRRTEILAIIDDRLVKVAVAVKKQAVRDPAKEINVLSRESEFLTGNPDSRPGLNEKDVFEYLAAMPPDKLKEMMARWRERQRGMA